jgi:hypothetical protein
MFLSGPSTENPKSRHEIAALLEGVTNGLHGLNKLDERVKSHRSDLTADSVEHNKRHDTLLTNTKKRSKEIYQCLTRQQENLVGELTAVLNRKFEEVSGHLSGSKKAEEIGMGAFEKEFGEMIEKLPKRYVSVVQIPNPFTKRHQ